MNEEEAREILKRIDIKFFLSGMNEQSNYIVDEADKVNKAIETVLNLLENKDKMIDLMAERLAEDTEWFYSEFDNYTKQDFIDYFTNKVEEDR